MEKEEWTGQMDPITSGSGQITICTAKEPTFLDATDMRASMKKAKKVAKEL